MYGLRLQCGRGGCLPHYRFSLGAADSNNNQQLCPLQRTLPHLNLPRGRIYRWRGGGISFSPSLLKHINNHNIRRNNYSSHIQTFVPTILKGIPSSFTLELPPYRKPQLGRIHYPLLYDRTLFVLVRAVSVAAPAGMITWVFANLHIGGLSLLQYGAGCLAPLARAIGLDGYILMAFILGFPANEIVIPISIISYMSAGQMVELDSLPFLRQLLLANGWTWLTAVCMMLFCLNHFPCGTTMLTIKKETQSLQWALVTLAVTTATGIILCFVAQSVRLLGLI